MFSLYPLLVLSTIMAFPAPYTEYQLTCLTLRALGQYKKAPLKYFLFPLEKSLLIPCPSLDLF